MMNEPAIKSKTRLTGCRLLILTFLTATSMKAQTLPPDYIAAAKTPHWHVCVQQFAAEPIRPGCYLFLGNSITAAFDLARHFPGWPAVNRGIAADHIDGLLDRLEGSVFVQQPARLFLLIGINDIGRGCPLEHMQLLYAGLVDTLQLRLPECRFFLQAILPTTAKWKNCPPQTIRSMNHFIAALAQERRMTYVDLHAAMADTSGDYLNPELTSDGLHLNETGYDIWREVLLRAVPAATRTPESSPE